ncbi:MAG TPA: hypothetical protein VIF62_31505 [Labilithrix sp.]|jgi:hypothetical protein
MRLLPALATAVVCLATACGGATSGSDDAIAEEGALASTPDQQRAAIVKIAHADAAGKHPGGRCYAAVAKYIDTVGYGKMRAQPKSAIGSLPAIPNDYSAYAHQFADYANDHLSELGLTRLSLDNPYDAPSGAIVVVRAGTPGTHHPTAGDIVVADGKGNFYNDGAMGYGGSDNFPPGNDFVLGAYLPEGSTQ